MDVSPSTATASRIDTLMSSVRMVPMPTPSAMLEPLASLETSSMKVSCGSMAVSPLMSDCDRLCVVAGRECRLPRGCYVVAAGMRSRLSVAPIRRSSCPRVSPERLIVKIRLGSAGVALGDGGVARCSPSCVHVRDDGVIPVQDVMSLLAAAGGRREAEPGLPRIKFSFSARSTVTDNFGVVRLSRKMDSVPWCVGDLDRCARCRRP